MQAAAARANLRVVHLSRHLQTLDILTMERVDRYNVLRGYAADPCASVAANGPEQTLVFVRRAALRLSRSVIRCNRSISV